MPIHDWTRVNAGTFHDMHVAWLGQLRTALNDGVLPPNYYAQAEQVAVAIGNPDVLTLRSGRKLSSQNPTIDDDEGGVAVATMPPHLAVHAVAAPAPILTFPRRRIVVRHASGDQPVAFIEIVSPANKDRADSVEQFVGKVELAIAEGLHVQVIDLFPPGPADPEGIHAAIWTRLGGTFDAPADRPLTLAAYVSEDPVNCYVEPVSVGQPLVDLPLFLTPGRYVDVPLERTYMAAYEGVPRRWKQVIEGA